MIDKFISKYREFASNEQIADLSDEVHMVELPDGTKARFHLPPDLS